MRRVPTLILIGLIFPFFAYGQQLGGTADSMTGRPLIVSVSPQYPSPYGKATLSFVSESLNLSNATITITVDGKQFYQGSVHSISIPLGKAGSTTRANIKLVSNGSTYTESVSIQPQDVSLIIEPLASVPPLYPGKALVPLDGNVRIVAVADFRNSAGAALDPTKLAYTWAVDDMNLANLSGIGKQTVIVASPLQYRTRDVSVTVTSQDGTLVGNASLTFSAEEPSLRIYENDPLLGIRFEHALRDNYEIASTEATFYAAPFSLRANAGNPLIQWFVNGSAAQSGSFVTLRPSGSGQGSATLSVTASDGGLNMANNQVLVMFNSKKNTNVFGL